MMSEAAETCCVSDVGDFDRGESGMYGGKVGAAVSAKSLIREVSAIHGNHHAVLAVHGDIKNLSSKLPTNLGQGLCNIKSLITE